MCDSLSCCALGLIQNLQNKVALHGVRLAIPGLETTGTRAETVPAQKGLLYILDKICHLELNGNLYSELDEIVTQEKMHLQEDPLLNGLLDSPELKVCLDLTVENMSNIKMKIVEVSWDLGMRLGGRGLEIPRLTSCFHVLPTAELFIFSSCIGTGRRWMPVPSYHSSSRNSSLARS